MHRILQQAINRLDADSRNLKIRPVELQADAHLVPRDRRRDVDGRGEAKLEGAGRCNGVSARGRESPLLPAAAGELIAPILALSAVLYLPWLIVLRCPAQNDAMRATLPWWTFARQELWSGRVPVWDPARLAGMPHLANIQSGTFYLPNWLLLPLPVHVAIGVSLVVHVTLTGILLAGFARSFDIRNAAASLAGMAYVTGAFASARMYAGHLTVLQCATWAPLMLLSARRLAITGRRSWAGVLGVAVWLSITAGYPALTTYSLMAAGVIFLGSLPVGARRLRPAMLGMVAVAAGTLSAAPALWPLLQLARQSTRAGGLSAAEASLGAMRLVDLPLLLWPWFFGADPMNDFWTGGLLFWHELQSASGIALLGMAALGFVRRREQRDVRCLMALALGSVVLALGAASSLAGGFSSLLQTFRIPARFLFVWTLVIPVLAGLGFDSLLGSRDAISRSFFRIGFLICNAGIAFELAVVAIACMRLSRGAQTPSDVRMLVATVLGLVNITVGMMGLIVLRSLDIQRERHTLRPKRLVYGMYGAILAELALVAGLNVYSPFRASVRSAAADFGDTDLHAIAHPGSRVAFAWPLSQYANLGALFGFRSVTAYDPLLLNRTTSLLRAGQDVEDPWGDASNNVLLSRDGGVTFDILGVEKFVDKTDTGVQMRTRTTQLSRLSIVEKSRFVTSARESLAAVLSDGFDPRAEVVLETPASTLRPANGTVSSAAAGSADIVDDRPGLVEARVDAPHGGYLLFSESYYPGWQAESQEQEVALVPADHAIMAVHLEPGSYSIRLRFTTPWLLPSMILACVGAAAIAALAWRGSREVSSATMVKRPRTVL